MGMYTGLRVKCLVKEEYRHMVNKVSQGQEWDNFSDRFSFLKKYVEQERAEFIPNGTLCYMPDEWHEESEFDDEFNKNTGVWKFQCSLKNYNMEIEQFLNDVLPNIIESAEHIEYFYEEWDESVLYEFVDGEIVKSSSRGISY